MKEQIHSLFRKLIQSSAMSGFESPVQILFREYAEPYLDEIYADGIGNCIGVRKGTGEGRLMLMAHADQVGFMVKYIDENGYVYFRPIGGMDRGLLPGLRVNIFHDGQVITGIMGRKSIHLQELDEIGRINPDEQWIDIGMKSRAEALEKIMIGDVGTFVAEVTEFGNGIVSAPGADNRIGLLVLLAVMRILEKNSTAPTIYYVASVQEELGLQGAMTISRNLCPDVAIVVDVTNATDYPTVNKAIHGDIRIGEGGVLPVSPDTSQEIIRCLIEIAKKNVGRFQIEAHSRSTNTECRVVRGGGNDIATGLISVPVRYMHSPNELFAWRDVDDVITILTGYCRAYKSE